jgi:hypothetical protein
MALHQINIGLISVQISSIYTKKMFYVFELYIQSYKTFSAWIRARLVVKFLTDK